MSIPFRKAYRFFVTDHAGNQMSPPMIAVGPVLIRAPAPWGGEWLDRWCFRVNADANDIRGFFGTVDADDGDVWVFKDTAKAREELPGDRWRFEVLTLKRLEDMKDDIALWDSVRQKCVDDPSTQSFFQEAFGKDWAVKGNLQSGVLPEVLQGKALIGSRELFEAISSGYPVGTVRKWGDKWVRKVGQPSLWKEIPPPGSDVNHVKVAQPELPEPDEHGWVEHDPSLTTDTRRLHHSDAGYSLERQKLHASIAEATFRGRKPVAADEKPTAIITIGVPAAGKSSLAREHAAGDKYVQIDPDLIRQKLPEYQEAVSRRSKSAAAITHNEARDLSESIRIEAEQKRYNFIFDALGQDPVYYKGMVDDLHTKGYHVVLLYPHVADVETAVGRARERGRKEGRWVNEQFIRQVAPRIPVNFHHLAQHVDEASLFAADTVPPQLVWERNDIGERTLNKSAYDDFLKAAQATPAKLGEAKEMPEVMPGSEIAQRYLRGLAIDLAILSRKKEKYAENEGIACVYSDPHEHLIHATGSKG